MYACVRFKAGRFRLPCGASLSIWLLAIALFCGVAGLFPVQAEDAPVIIRLSTVGTPTMPTSRSLIHFKERVEAESQGAIQVQIYFSSSLYSDNQAAFAVSSGAVEMAYVLLHRFSDNVPVANAFQLPFMFNTSALEKAARLPDSEVRSLIDVALLTMANARPLWWIRLGQTVLLAKGTSLANPESMANKVVRTFSPLTETIVLGCGAVPRDIESSDQLRAYSSGDVDVGMTTPIIAASRGLWKAMDTITNVNIGSMEAVVVMNEPFFRKLSAQNRAIVIAAAQAMDAEAAETAAQDETESFKQLEEKGVKFVDLTEEELQFWRVCTSDALLDFINKSGPAGQGLMSAYGRMRARTEGGAP